MTANPKGSAKPATPSQELLLKAALFSGDEALLAWAEWEKSINWEDHLEAGSFRLLPLLYDNLYRQGLNHPLMGKLKGIYRNAWSKNQILFHEMSGVVGYLQDEGIRIMLLKGAPLSILYYKNNGSRPMADIDVLVPQKQAHRAIELLKRAGWTSPMPLTEMDLIHGHAIQLKNSVGREFDLHWRPFNGCHDQYENDFWDGAVPVRMSNVTSLSPNPSDMLFHVIVHGMAWNPVPPIRWIADAITLIHSKDFEIDWQRAIRFAVKHHMGLRFKKALQYLRDTFRPFIPPDVMRTVDDLPVWYLEKIEYDFLMSNRETEKRNPYAAFCCHLCRFQRLNKGNIPLAAFSRSLQWRLNAKNKYELIMKGLRVSTDLFLSRPLHVRQR